MDEACALALELLGLENKGYKLFSFKEEPVPNSWWQPIICWNEKPGTSILELGHLKPLRKPSFLGKYWNWHLPKIRTSITSQKISIFPPISTIFIVLATIRSSEHKFINFPKLRSLVVCDMSSDIFSRQLDFQNLIWSPDPKNMGLEPLLWS